MFGKTKSPLSEAQVRESLKQVKFPGFSRDIVSFGIVKSIAIADNNDVTVALHVMTRDPVVPEKIQQEARGALETIPGIGQVTVEIHDSGPGLSAYAKGTLFEPTISFKKTGMGLGLSIAKRSALMLGGDITPIDGVLGGAGFRLVLPRAGE